MSRSDSYSRRFDEDVQQNDHNTCPECGGRVTTNTRETVCDDCGLVVEEQRVDPGPEWREFPDRETRERTGAPRTAARHDWGLSTEIGETWKADGQLSTQKRRQLNRLRREHRRSRYGSKRERNQMHGLFEVRHVADELDLGDEFQEQASQLFRTAQNGDLLRGRSIESFGAAAAYAVIRVNGLPRTETEVAEAARCTAEAFRNAYHVLNRELDLPTAPQRPRQYIPQFASALNLPNRVRIRAVELAEWAAERGLSNGQRPSGFAAACLLVAATRGDVRVTQTELASVADVSPMTVRKQRDRIRAEFDRDPSVPA
jgi:transcription initiation factor TFIIB